MESVWEQTVRLPSYERLTHDIQTDVLIIGGGLTGILCASALKEAGVNCVVAEASVVCGGVTRNTTAKITVQHGLVYDRLIQRFGVQKASQYLAANREALSRYAALSKSTACDFERKDSYVYTLRSSDALEREQTALEKLLFDASLCGRLSLPFPVNGALCIRGQAQFNPLKFVLGQLKGLTIYEHTPVRRLVGTTAHTDGGTIRAEKIIVATHFPYLNRHGFYFLKLYQHRSYVRMLQGAEPVDGLYIDEEQGGLSFRSYGQTLLLGGGGHRSGKAGGGYEELNDFSARFYPGAKETGRFATQDCMTLDGVPYIGRYRAGQDRIFVATGFNKWGMTTAMAASLILRDEILGKRHPCAPVFDPSRSILRPQLAVNATEAVVNLLNPAAPRCPHMGCRLCWNRQEHTWDCPCHGSRFTQTGRLLDNPAETDLQVPPAVEKKDGSHESPPVR